MSRSRGGAASKARSSQLERMDEQSLLLSKPSDCALGVILHRPRPLLATIERRKVDTAIGNEEAGLSMAQATGITHFALPNGRRKTVWHGWPRDLAG